ncbi:acyltransferase family protein [Microbacterium sp. NPDC057407]|uniref:acyltransferase family protein n=1 Tax=Microbacterium sp. NPDC057407 TaxID=3346120 RepID=UPI00366AD1E0
MVREAASSGERVMTGFRPEIQALRTVAVLGVIIFHLWPRALPGGFVGVDVFFVISGYLITLHLVREHERTGRIALSRFYARRIRRLLPAAMLVLLTTAVAVIALVPIDRMIGFLRQIAASALYIENWVLAAESVDYFATDGPESPVQHYWSLSVEEQFYLAWPLLILFALALAARRARGDRSRMLLGVLGTVAVAGFAFAAAVTAIAPQPAYFSTFAHVWEFAAGAVLAVMHARGSDPGRMPPGWAAGLLWAAFGAIAVSMLLFSSATAVPGPWTAIPVAAVIVIIAVGRSSAKWSPTPLVDSRPVQFLGDTSYSAYLWHWPLIVLIPYALGRELDLLDNLLIFAVTILLAWATRVLIERPPVRSPFWSKRWVSYGFAAASAAIVVALCVVPTIAISRQSSDALDRVIAGVEDPASCVGAGSLSSRDQCDVEAGETADPALALGEIEYEDVAIDVAARTGSRGDCAEGPFDSRRCTFVPDVASGERIAVVGDSHVEHLLPALGWIPSGTGWSVDVYEKRSCPFIDPAWRAEGAAEYKQNDPDCVRWREETLAALAADPEIDTVVTTTYAHRVGVDGDVSDQESMTAALRATWDVLEAAGKRVVVIADTPLARENDMTRCLEEASASRECALERDAALPADPLAASVDPSSDGRTLIDLTEEFCLPDTCLALAGGMPVYADRHHILPGYALTLAPALRDGIRSALDP